MQQPSFGSAELRDGDECIGWVTQIYSLPRWSVREPSSRAAVSAVYRIPSRSTSAG